MRKTLNISLPEDLYERIKSLAKERSISMSSCICSILSGNLPTSSETDEEDVDSKSECTIRLRGKSAHLLRKRAQAYGVSPTIFVKNLITGKEMVVVNLDNMPAYEMHDMFSQCHFEISSFVNSLKEGADKEQIAFLADEVKASLLLLEDSFDRYYEDFVDTKKHMEKRIVKKMKGK